MHVSFADKNNLENESFGSSWGGKRDLYGAITEVSAGTHHVKPKRRVTFFRNRPSLTIDFGLFAFSSSQRDIAWYSLYCFIYILIAVVAFSYLFESWSYVDSIYFSITTFTTTGFGDKVSVYANVTIEWREETPVQCVISLNSPRRS